jgi:hypothetical protein
MAPRAERQKRLMVDIWAKEMCMSAEKEDLEENVHVTRPAYFDCDIKLKQSNCKHLSNVVYSPNT